MHTFLRLNVSFWSVSRVVGGHLDRIPQISNYHFASGQIRRACCPVLLVSLGGAHGQFGLGDTTALRHCVAGAAPVTWCILTGLLGLLGLLCPIE